MSQFKLRSAIVLPVLLLCLAFPVARWDRHAQSQVPPKREYPFVSTPTLIYRGINAPALLFQTLCTTYLPIYRPNHAPPSFLGLAVADLLFFVGIAVLWVIVGLEWERHRELSAGARPDLRTARAIFHLLLMVFGALLLWAGIRTISDANNTVNPLGNVLEGLLFVTWSGVLILFPGSRFVHAIHRWRARTGG